MKGQAEVVGVFFGGKSAEHEISILSAKSIMTALRKSSYRFLPIYIDKEGYWHECDENALILHSYTFFEGCSKILPKINVAFPAMHGPFGEDGSIQGFFEVAGIPYVGSKVLGSAIAMDKEVTKRLLQGAQIPTTKFAAYRNIPDFFELKEIFGLPFFIKPANLGSSIGISKVTTEAEFEKAANEAFLYDEKILIEEAVKEVREFECSVLEDGEHLRASLPGELSVTSGFYSYEAKYIDKTKAVFTLPAKLPENEIRHIQELSLRTFKTLCLKSMARIDFFRESSGRYLVSEANSIPGFTPISLYPKLWELSGISYTELISKLIEQALKKPKSWVLEEVGQK